MSGPPYGWPPGGSTITTSAPLSGNGTSGSPATLAADRAVLEVGTCTTALATTETMFSIPTATGFNYLASVEVIVRDDLANYAFWLMTLVISNTGGVVTVGPTQGDGGPAASSPALSGTVCEPIVSGQNVEIHCTGVALRTIKWGGTLRLSTTPA